MSERRTLTIGVAINLGNYESLRLEVSDEAGTEQEAAELAAYLDRILSGYGSGDAGTRAAIDKYRARVLARVPASEEEEPIEDIPMMQMPEPEPEPVWTAEIQEEPTDAVSPEPEIPITIEEPVTIAPPQPEPVSLPQEVPPQDEPGNTFVCEKCGAAVSKVQRDVSNLFMGKTLCKSCMK